MKVWLAGAVLLVVSGGLFAALTVWTDHTTSTQLAGLDEPANVHRAVARLRLHWRRVVDMLRRNVDRSSKADRSELKQSRPSAHLLDVSACVKIVPR